jgi:hypothetical protein
MFADLPALPDMPAAPPRRALTLVGMLQATRERTGPRGRFGLMAAAVLLACGIGTAVVYRRVLVQRIVPKPAAVAVHSPEALAPVLTPQQQAARALTQGSQAYTARDYGHAISLFEQALSLDPTLGEAHRALGIVHADLHDEAEAVAHYQKYLEMAPHAKDAARVKKIIDDYALAHAPPPAPEAAAPVAPVAPVVPPASGHRHPHPHGHRRPR